MYEPQKSRDFNQYIRLAVSKFAPAAETGELRPITKPDTDNYAKGIKDGLNKVIWQDDSQIAFI